MTQSPGNPEHLDSFRARFLAVVSHELRTPLTTIASFTDALAENELPPGDRPAAIAAVRRNTDRMLTLVEDLMLLGRLATGDLPLTVRRVPLAQVLDAAIDQLRATAPDLSVRGEPADAPHLNGDEHLLSQLFYAVLAAVSGQAEERVAEVSATVAGDGWTIEVLGRSAEELTEEHLLATRVSVPAAPERQRSLALWMLMADTIVERHGGTVTTTYEPSIGVRVTIRLPGQPPGAQKGHKLTSAP